MSDSGEALCAKCNKNCNKGQKAIECTICERWTHQKCSDIDAKEYDMLEYMHKKRGYHWYKCEGCQAGYANLQKQVEVLNNTLRDIKEKVDKNTSDIQANKDRLDTMEDTVQKATDKLVNGTNSTTEKSVLDEINDRESRRNNMMIFNLDEPGSEVSQGMERKKMDGDKLTDVFKCLDTEIDMDDDIRFFTRTGELKDGQTKPRPMLIGFKNVQKRSKILDNLKKLARTKYKTISIVPDLTAKQRLEDQNLRKEAEKKNEELDEEEQGNWEWKVVGLKGHRRLVKTKIYSNKKRQHSGTDKEESNRQATRPRIGR